MSNEQTQADLSADEIEAQLRMTRIELTNTVDQLVTQLHPSYQIEQAKQNAQAKVEELKERARSTWEVILMRCALWELPRALSWRLSALLRGVLLHA